MGVWGGDLWLASYLCASSIIMDDRSVAIIRLLGATANVLARSSELTDDDEESMQMMSEANKMRSIQSFYAAESGFTNCRDHGYEIRH